MQPEKILKSDVLDILFENRNKQYGAYILRRDYDARLRKAMLITFSLAALILLLAFGFKAKDKNIRAAITSEIFDIKPIPKSFSKKITSLKKHANTLAKKTIQTPVAATILRKTVIVQDPLANNNITKTTEALKGNISTIKMDGIISTGLQNIVTGSGDENKNINPSGSETANDIDNSAPINNPDVYPDFPGGKEALLNFLKKNLTTPGDLNEEIISVKIQFIVNADGSISGFTIVQSGGDDFDNEVLRVLKKMPHWIPGKSNGHNVAVYYEVPVKFVADNN